MAAKTIFAVLLCGLLLMTIACGGGSPESRPVVYVSVTPGAANVEQGANFTFHAAVTGKDSSVTWSVQEGAAGGTIAPDGTYTAPAKAGLYHIVATSVASPSSTSSATVNVPAVTLTLSQTKITMDQGATQLVYANVYGAVDRSVSWTFQESGMGGSVSSTGLLTAPTTAGTYHIVATSTWDTTQTATLTLVVEASSVTVMPRVAGVAAGNKYPFTATVRGLLDKRVAWSIQEGSIGGTIDSNGVYTPSSTAGTYHIVATSAADSSVFAAATAAIVTKRFSEPIPMMEARTLAAATLLQNGDVLVTGGNNGDWWFVSVNSAEIFDHAAGTFRSTGSMGEGRDSHTATLLKDGKVLVAGGGLDWWGSTTAAEVFDPATEKFTTTGKMGSARSAHTATLLQDGKVLIAGGVDWNAFTMPAAAEIYDPTTGTFKATGAMVEPRWWHTATLLPDGRVLFAGGTARISSTDYGLTARASVEIYDPSTGTFSPAGSMGGKHEQHAAALLADGRVLITGGQDYVDTGDPYAYLYSYQDDAHVVGAPSWNSAPLVARMNTVRAAHTSTVLEDGQVLIAGGYTLAADNSAELFDPATETFLITDSMAKPRYLHTATRLQDGRVLIAGGAEQKTAEIYDPKK